MGARDAGFSLVELTIALGLTMVAMMAVVTMMQPARGAVAALPEGADMQQRLRVGVDTLTRDLMMAGAGPYVVGHSGPLSDVFAPVMPFRRAGRDPLGTFRTDTITVIAVPTTAAQTTLSADVVPGSPTLQVEPAAGCPIGVNLCGFAPGMTLLAFDDTGAFDTFTVAAVVDAASQIAVAAWPTGAPAYRAGTPVVEVQVHTYSLKTDLATRISQLVHDDDSGSPEVPVVDHVVRLEFEYYGASLAPIAAGDDLRGIRTVGVTIRVEAALAALRGPAGTLFSNGGTATSAHAWMPDQEIRFQVSPRNLNLSR